MNCKTCNKPIIKPRSNQLTCSKKCKDRRDYVLHRKDKGEVVGAGADVRSINSVIEWWMR